MWWMKIPVRNFRDFIRLLNDTLYKHHHGSGLFHLNQGRWQSRGRWLTLLLVGYHVRYLERPVTVETDEIKTAKITNCILVYLIFNKKIFLEVNYKLCILIDMVHRLGLVTVIGLKMKGLEQRNPVHRAPISNNTDKRGLIYVGI